METVVNQSVQSLELNQLQQFIQQMSEGSRNGLWDQLEISDLQKLAEAVVKCYGYRLEAYCSTVLDAEPFMPIPSNNTLPETETMMFINGLMESKHIELFELQMFKSF